MCQHIMKENMLLLKDLFDEGSEFYSRTWPGKNKIEIYQHIMKVLNLNLVIMLEYQNIKIFLKKVTFQVGLKKFLWLQKLKIMCRH